VKAPSYTGAGTDFPPPPKQVTNTGIIVATLWILGDVYNSTWLYDLPDNR
jgi:hypothetical protein